VVGGKKRSQNSPDQITIRKQPKADNCWQEKPILTYNIFEGLEEEPGNINNNIIPVREAKHHPNFISEFSDPSSLR